LDSEWDNLFRAVKIGTILNLGTSLTNLVAFLRISKKDVTVWTREHAGTSTHKVLVIDITIAKVIISVSKKMLQCLNCAC
jgi:hypothetical protein